VMRQVGEHLVTRGHEVTVATSYLRERKSRSHNGVSIVEFGATGNHVRGLRGEVDAYRRFILQSNYDVFMVKAAQQWTFDALWPILDEMRGPIVFVPCGFSGLFDPMYRAYFRDMRRVLSKFDHLIFYASSYRDIDFARDNGLRKYSVLPNAASEREFGVAVDHGFRTRHGIAKNAFVVLTVGTLTGGLKGHHQLAEAFARANFGDRPAVLILNGNKISTVARIREPLNARRAFRTVRTRVRAARDRLHVTPMSRTDPLTAAVSRINEAAPGRQAVLVDLPRPEVVQAYLNSNLFVLASKIEYSPLVLFEAAAAGLPFLSVPVGNAGEIAEWTGAGEICPAPRDELGYTQVDPQLLGEHISRLASDPDHLAELGRSGRQAWVDRFNWKVVAAQYEELFLKLIAPPRVA